MAARSSRSRRLGEEGAQEGPTLASTMRRSKLPRRMNARGASRRGSVEPEPEHGTVLIVRYIATPIQGQAGADESAGSRALRHSRGSVPAEVPPSVWFKDSTGKVENAALRREGALSPPLNRRVRLASRS